MLEYAAIVDRGLVHATNDDEALINHNIIDDGLFYGKCREDKGLFAVADGVGSMDQSVIASRLALREIADCDPGDEEGLYVKIDLANKRILDRMEKLRLYNGLSSTLCIASVIQEKIVSYNLGNSRLYRCRFGSLHQLTKDQTKVQELYEAGLIEENEIAEHPQKNLITGYIGNRDFQISWIDKKECTEKFKIGDYLLLCSDGLHDYVDIDQMEDIFSECEGVKKIAVSLVEAAAQKGGNDNVTVIVIKRTGGVQ